MTEVCKLCGLESTPWGVLRTYEDETTVSANDYCPVLKQE